MLSQENVQHPHALPASITNPLFNHIRLNGTRFIDTVDATRDQFWQTNLNCQRPSGRYTLQQYSGWERADNWPAVKARRITYQTMRENMKLRSEACQEEYIVCILYTETKRGLQILPKNEIVYEATELLLDMASSIDENSIKNETQNKNVCTVECNAKLKVEF